MIKIVHWGHVLFIRCSTSDTIENKQPSSITLNSYGIYRVVYWISTIPTLALSAAVISRVSPKDLWKSSRNAGDIARKISFVSCVGRLSSIYFQSTILRNDAVES